MTTRKDQDKLKHFVQSVSNQSPQEFDSSVRKLVIIAGIPKEQHANLRAEALKTITRSSGQIECPKDNMEM